MPIPGGAEVDDAPLPPVPQWEPAWPVEARILATFPEAKAGYPIIEITNPSDEHNWFVGSISVVENHQSSWADYYHPLTPLWPPHGGAQIDDARLLE